MSSDLRLLFEPRSVALIGASADPQSISARPLRLLRQHGYGGQIYPVNPKYTELFGLPVYPSISAVPSPVDLALVVVPAGSVIGVLEECAAAGVATAMVITSGFAESGVAGLAMQQAIVDLVARTGLRVCGPNSEGLYNPAGNLCATFSPAVDPQHGFVAAPAGPIAIVSQSGGMAFALMNHAHDRGLAVGAVVSTGNEVDLGWADYVDYLLDDPSCHVILGFVESFRRPRRLLDVARKAAHLKKPLVVAKIGRSEAGRRAAASHTASLVGSDAAYSAAFRQLGMVRVDDVDEMCDVAAYFSVGRLPAGRRVAVLTASGGAGAWLADASAICGLDLPPPDTATQAAIQAFIPTYGSVANPVDITAQAALSGGFERALGHLARSSRFDTVVAVGTLVREERFFETLPELESAIEGTAAATVYYSYTRASPKVLAALAELGIPCFSTPGRTARAMAAAAEYAEFLRGAGSVAVLRDDGSPGTWPAVRGPLSESGARAYLAPLGIPSPEDRSVQSADAAVAAWQALGGGPVALKIQAADVPHKTDIGGVHLGLASEAEVRAGYEAIMASNGGELGREGVLVQRMAPPNGVEVLVAARHEPLLGPLVVVGLGGVQVESLADVAMRLAPISLPEARAMIAELRGAAVLHGWRGRPPADVEALASALVRLSDLAVGLPTGVSNVELNPLLVLPVGEGVLMLDAAIEFEEQGDKLGS
ncbi:MAG TPA: acetate--CoA ligase family protein [Chloroflexota bacterium]|nr:acetate--CoA ligase family protein [Chloroflexota bacterium]